MITIPRMLSVIALALATLAPPAVAQGNYPAAPIRLVVGFAPGGVILSLAFGEKLSYDVFKDLTPVALLTSSPQLMVAYPALPANSASEFTAYLRSELERWTKVIKSADIKPE